MLLNRVLFFTLFMLLFSTGVFADDLSKLFSAASNGKIDIVKQIINKRPELIDAQNIYGRAPIRLAYNKNHTEIVDWLIKKGAKIDIIFASEKGDLKKVKALINSDKNLINYRDKLGTTALYWATLYGHMDIVQFLLENWAETDAKSNNGSAPIFCALSSSFGPPDKSEILKMLIKNGADVNLRDGHGLTPLHRVAHSVPFENKVKILTILIENGAELNAVSDGSNTPLCTALLSTRIEAAEFMIDNRADINKQCALGNTPLHIALEMYIQGFEYMDDQNAWRDKILKSLIRKKPDMDIKNDKGLTSLEFANKNKIPLLKWIEEEKR